MSRFSLPPLIVGRFVKDALFEDLGFAGDITTTALFSLNIKVPLNIKAKAKINCRSGGVVAGMDLAKAVFRQTGDINFTPLVEDGEHLAPNTEMAKLEGDAHGILSGERTALNFLAHLSGIATQTEKLVQSIRTTKAKVCCTRKTLPGLRLLQKYAVRCGGGTNHRFSLSDAILIKDNHIAVAGGIKQALEQAHAFAGPLTAIELEVDTLAQLSEALECSPLPHVIMLDNMTPEQLNTSVALVGGRCLLEASGNITAETILTVAQTGVDFISTSQITQSAPALDLSLDSSPA